jgi:hypothetical protein
VSTHRFAAVLTLALSPVIAAWSAPAPAAEPSVLARVDIHGPVAGLGLPIHAQLLDGQGREYALVIAPVAELTRAGAPFSVLSPHTPGARYAIGLERRPGSRATLAGRSDLLLDDGLHVLLPWSDAAANLLGALGFTVSPLLEEPMSMRVPETPPVDGPMAYDARVATMVAAVTQTTVSDYDGRLSGETPVTVGGSSYTIATRNTNTGTPITKATQYVYEHLQARGYAVSYHTWGTSRNVVGQKTGTIRPTEIVLITAHLDDMPSGSLAPGADDNASGSVGLMIAADIMKDYYFERTYRLVFFTGEEQGLLGAAAYATLVKNAGENIVAVYNMDMIAWDSVGGPTLRLHTRTTTNPGYASDLAIANVFTGVVNDYGLSGSLTPIIDADGTSGSDHYEFWGKGYPAVLAIEDDSDDFNDYYHTTNDRRQYLNMPYFTAFVKASIGTAAHLAYPTEAPCQLGLTATAAFLDGYSATGTSSNLNGILEPGESVLFAPTWKYPLSCGPSLVTGAVSGFAGPGGFSFGMPDAAASYGTMNSGGSNNCRDKTGNCYVLQVSNPATRPSVHVDATLTEALNWGISRTWTLHVGRSFSDVDPSEFYYPYVERILHRNVTVGCMAGKYCPGDPVRRHEMAAFLARGMAGGDGAVPTSGGSGATAYNCVGGGSSPFGDVLPTDQFCKHIGYIFAHGVTQGCGGGNYCQAWEVTRWQMAGFVARALAGSNDAVPLTYTGPGGRTYSCDPASPNLHFEDVAITDEFCRHIHYLWAKEVIDGCSPTGYCPAPNVTRGEMAKFLANGFSLGLYTP